MQFSCLLIGQDNLLIECGNYLIERTHHIQWVVTPNPSIQSWCDTQNIAWVTSLNELPEQRTHSVDYLFSIVNGTILQGDELNIARIASINYHDALLPKYAGVNATTWALVQDEKEHGITWHHINTGIDKGDIVYQSRFSIHDQDTALTLNLRCFEEAVQGFIHIIKQLETGILPATPQENNGRSYYGINHPLPNLGFINWQTDDAVSIHRCYRALNFGTYSNKVGTLKLYLNTDYLSVTQVEFAKDSGHSGPAGQILALSDDGVLVNTHSNPIWLKGLYCQSGHPINKSELTHRHKFQIGSILPQIEQSFIDSHTEDYKKALRAEPYWIKQLTQVSEHSLFTDRTADHNAELKQLAQIELNDTNTQPGSIELLFLSTLLLYLYRINNYEPCTLYYQPEENYHSLFTGLLPFSTETFDSEMTFQSLLDCVETQLTKIKQAGIYLNDVRIRQPALSASIAEAKEYLITFGFANQAQNDSKKSLIHFEMNQHIQQLTVSHRVNTDFQGGSILPLLHNMQEHLTNLIHEIQINPDRPIHQFCFLSKQERNHLLHWSVGEYRALPSNTLTELFEQRVRFEPNKVIIEDQDTQMTYHQLWSEAEKITCYLRNNNIQPGSTITIQGFKGSQLIAVTLGILKSGCIGKLINESECLANPSLIVDCPEQGTQSIPGDALFTQSPKLPQNDLSLAKQSCLELAKERKPLDQKQLINYCYWLANHKEINQDTTINIPEDANLDNMLSYSLSALLVRAKLSFKMVA